ncbi:MAG: hypothetical protein HY908_28980 [Myxococcales bacterium]|nr:hypothetical protein [Myxococcales bacterium]
MDPIVAAIAARTHEGGFVRPAGNPSQPRLGLSSVVGGGVEAIAPDGRRHVLVRGLSPWVWPAILSAVGVFVEVALAFALGAERGLLPLLVLGLMFVLFAAITVGAYVAGRRKARQKLVFDAPGRICRELRGAEAGLSVPAALMRATHVQVQASAGYADVFDVLVDLGFAELWIHQTDEPTARALAATIAEHMGIPFEPALVRRPGV